MLKYLENPVTELGLPASGVIPIDLSNVNDPEIPEFLSDRVSFYKDVCVTLEDSTLVIKDPAYLKVDHPKLEHIIIVHGVESSQVLREGERATLKYNVVSEYLEGVTSYGYCVSLE